MEKEFLQLLDRAMSLDAAARKGKEHSKQAPGENLEAAPKISTPSTKQRQAKPDGLRRSLSASKLNNVPARPSSSRRASSTRNLFPNQKSPSTSRRPGSSRTLTVRPRSKSPMGPSLRPVPEPSKRQGSSRNLRPRSKSPTGVNNSRPRRQGSQRNLQSRPRSKSPLDSLSSSRHQSGRPQDQRRSRSKSPTDPMSTSRHQEARRVAKPQQRSKSPTDPSASPRHQSWRRVTQPRSRSKSPADPVSSPRRRASRRQSATNVSRSGSPGGSEHPPVSHRPLQFQPVAESRRKNSFGMSPKSARSENSRAVRRGSRGGSSRTPASSDISASKSPSSRNLNETEHCEMPSFPELVDDPPDHQSGYPYTQAMSGTMQSDHLEEDDDIIDDEDEHSLAVARFRRQTGLPPDPSSASHETHESIVPRSGNDRFDASFKNHERWMGGEQQAPSQSNFLSLTSPESVDRIATTKDQASISQRTPKTPKTNNVQMRNGSRRSSRVELSQGPENSQYSPSKEDATGFPRNEDEDKTPSQKQRKHSPRKKKPVVDSVLIGGGNDGRSSAQGSAMTLETIDSHHGRGGDQPSGVPTYLIPSGTTMSPMTASFTSTPNSRLSSSRSRPKKNSLQGLLRFHSSTGSKMNGNSVGLDGHLGKDEISVGASTITTNFTATQRDRDDATVSERSLFEPTSSINPSQMPRIPQRRTATFDELESDGDDSSV